MNIIELMQATLGVRKSILNRLTGTHAPLTRTALQGSPAGVVTADGIGQWCRVGPYTLGGGRTRAYDWYRADTTTAWRLVEDLAASFVSAVYATLGGLELKANATSPALLGTPTTTQPDLSDNSARIATTQFVKGQAASNAPSDAIYDATAWNANQQAPTKNAVRDKFVSIDAAIAGVGGGGSSVVVSATVPTNLTVGWFDPETGILAYYVGGGWVTQLTGGTISSAGAVTFGGETLTFGGEELTFT